MADSNQPNPDDVLDAEYNLMRRKFFTKFPNGEMHPGNEDVRNKVLISIHPHATETDQRTFSGYSGNTNMVQAQKEAAIQAFKHMGLDMDLPVKTAK